MAMIPFDDRDGVIWLDGKLIPWREADLHVLSHALHYASAVFEGERVYGREVFKLRELVLPAGSETHLEGSVSFAEMTTRKHRPGLHRIDLVVNGVSYDLGEFEVVP